MRTFWRFFPTAASLMPRLLSLSTLLLARSLQMAELLIESAGIYVVAQMQAVETSAGKGLCPLLLLRRLFGRR